jgi:hypothetical protein
MAKNVCPCPSPPGGQATCEEKQLAICRVVNGAPVFECITLPSKMLSLAIGSGGNDPKYLDFVLEVVTRGVSRTLPDAERQQILSQREFTHPITGEKTRFNAPNFKRAGEAFSVN